MISEEQLVITFRCKNFRILHFLEFLEGRNGGLIQGGAGDAEAEDRGVRYPNPQQYSGSIKTRGVLGGGAQCDKSQGCAQGRTGVRV